MPVARKCARFLGVALVAGALLLKVDPSAAQARLDLNDEKLAELISGGLVLDETSFTPGDGSFGGGGKPPRAGVNVQVNDVQKFFPDGLVGRSETAIVANEGGQGLLAGWNDADGFCALGTPCTINQVGLSGFGFSKDGGKTWTDGGAPPLFDDVFTFGDPWLDRGGFDKKTYYYSNLAAADLGFGAGGLSVHRGRFNSAGDFVWEDGRFLAPAIPTDFFDKEAIAARKDGSGLVILSFTNFLDLSHPSRRICPPSSPFGFGEIQVFRSVDGGSTYSGPIVVGPDLTASANCRLGTSQQSSSPAFGPNGQVYIVWERGPTFTNTDITPQAQIVVAASLDGGFSWKTPVKVADINHMRGAPPVAYNRNRINNHPRIAVADNGRIYVTFSSLVSPVSGVPVTISCPVTSTIPCVAQNLTSSQVFLSFSNDRGATWSTPKAIAPAVPATGVKRFWPTVSVGQGSTLDVTYYESLEKGLTPSATDIECNRALQGNVRRAGTAVSLMSTFWVRSADGGATFNKPVRVSDVSSNWCQVGSNIIPNMGDYIFSVSNGNDVLSTWADGRNGVPDTFYTSGLAAGQSGK
jgi:hypothetical protein